MTLASAAPTPCLVLVRNIDAQVTAEKLREFFEFCGDISEIQISESDEGKEALILFASPVRASLISHSRV